MSVSNIFFIDDRVQYKETLFDAIDTSAKWYVLDASLDGVEQTQNRLLTYLAASNTNRHLAVSGGMS